LAAVTEKHDATPPDTESPPRESWQEGPDEEAPEESWLSLADDELVHRIETLAPEINADEQLLRVVRSERHFFIRQEAAKRIRDHSLLFPFEDDRHVGQILVRYLTRREDVTYLERLVARSRHVEVRAAAQVQLAQLWGRLGGPTRVSPGGDEAPPPPEFEKPASSPPEAAVELAVTAVEPSVTAVEPAVTAVDPVVEPTPPGEGVDGSLLGWAVHFIVEQVWAHLGTGGVRDLLVRTHAELLPPQPALSFFRVEKDAHVHVDLSRGPRLPTEAVAGVATWMMAFLHAARSSAPDMNEIDVRQSTQLMADALGQAGFYAACEAAESTTL
jgi:hypothetical protein